MKKIFAVICLSTTVLFLSMLTPESNRSQQEENATTRDSLMAYRWDFFDNSEDKVSVAFMEFSDTHLKDTEIWLEDGSVTVDSSRYYLSEFPVNQFDETKVGQTENGRYIVVRTKGNDFVCYQINTLLDDILVLIRRNPYVTISTYYAATHD